MEDDLKQKKLFSIPLKYGRRPQKKMKWKTTSKKKLNGRRPQKKNEKINQNQPNWL